MSPDILHTSDERKGEYIVKKIVLGYLRACLKSGSGGVGGTLCDHLCSSGGACPASFAPVSSFSGPTFDLFRQALSKHLAQTRQRAQGIVEFALISLLLFTLLIGIIEMGRMMFLFSQVASAAQEGTRFGVIHPYQIVSSIDDCGAPICYGYPEPAHTDNPCNIVAQARARTVLIPTQRPISDTQSEILNVEVGFDHGDLTHTMALQTPPGFMPGTDRVVVTASYSMTFMTPLLSSFGPIKLQMVSARTIMQDQEEQVAAPVECPDGEPMGGN